jgi:hypothetical protein
MTVDPAHQINDDIKADFSLASGQTRHPSTSAMRSDRNYASARGQTVIFIIAGEHAVGD